MAMFVIRIFKSWGARDESRRWVNNYEIEAGAATLTSLDTVANALASAEKLIHMGNVNFLSATISTWEPDSQPYNPLSFRTIELSGIGTKNVAGVTTLSSNVCFVVKYQATTGRNGRRFYRGCLTEADVESGGDGSFTLTAAGPLLDAGADFTAFKTAMAPYLSGGANATKIVLAGASGIGVQREVSALKSGGVSINRRNHRYFDRAA
jgi:hypothetical protein